MEFQVEALSIELIEALRPIVPRIKRHDRSLADQLIRAASSIALNIAESNYSDPNETRAALRIAVAWGYVVPREAEGARALVERAVAMLWKLTR